MNTEHINLQEILLQSVKKSNGVIPSIIILSVAYWIQDVVFFSSFSKFTSNVPKFIENISVESVGILISPYIISELLFFINNIIVSYTIPQIELEVVENLITKTLESIKTAKTNINTNEYVMNLKKIIESKSVYYLIVTNIIPTILIAFGIIYYFLISNIKFGIVVIAILIIFTLITLNIFNESIKASYNNENAINTMYDNIQEIISSADLVVTSNSINKEVSNINNDKNLVYDTYLTSEKISSEAQLKLRLVSLCVIILLDALAIYLYYKHILSIESTITICTMSIIFLKYYNSMIGRFKGSIGYIGKFYEINDYFSHFKIHDNLSDQNFIIKNGNIVFKNIYVKINNKEILKNFNFNVKENTKIGIIGDIGKGKTTILKILSGLLNYDGIIEVDGQDIKKYKYESVMNNIVYISQNPKIFNKNIYYNLCYGVEKSESEIIEYLKKLDFLDFYKVFPEGIYTKTGKDGSKLSGGQKQLISILRALIQNKKIMLIDEPTNSLDIQSKNVIINLINNIKNKTILIVTHDENMFHLFDDFIEI
jgi:ABC-type multidrug transport system fused ATPase/permease subunit